MSSSSAGYLAQGDSEAAVDGSGNVYYISSNQNIHQMTWNGTQYQDINLMTSSQSGALAAASYTISGQVTANGSGGFGVVIALTGTRNYRTVTDSNGNYSFSVPAASSYTLTPTLPGVTFSPASNSQSNLTANATANFSEQLITISGTIDAGFGVTVALTGTSQASTTTDGMGNYSFSLPSGGTYTVTPSLSGFTFTPASQGFSNTVVNQVANFTSASSGSPGIPAPPTPAPSTYAYTASASGMIVPPNSQNQFYFHCYQTTASGTTPIQGCDISISTGYYAQTNAHLHESSTHPFSSASPSSGYTDANGNFAFTISTTLIGQIEYFVGASTVNLTNNGIDYAIGYGDLVYGDIPAIWTRIGGSDTGGGSGHGTTDNNRYMTLTTYDGLYYATQRYLLQHPTQTQICVNDATLPIGGKFDISQTWSSPHAEHDRGSAVDVADTAGQCPANSIVNATDFARACRDAGAVRVIVHVPPEAPHVHCNWQDPRTFPH